MYQVNTFVFSSHFYYCCLCLSTYYCSREEDLDRPRPTPSPPYHASNTCAGWKQDKRFSQFVRRNNLLCYFSHVEQNIYLVLWSSKHPISSAMSGANPSSCTAHSSQGLSEPTNFFFDSQGPILQGRWKRCRRDSNSRTYFCSLERITCWAISVTWLRGLVGKAYDQQKRYVAEIAQQVIPSNEQNI